MQIRPGIFRSCVTLLLFLAGGLVQAEDSPAEPKAPAQDVQRVADRIDELIARRWKEAGVTPAEPASDAEFLRRVSLHIDGGIPPVFEVRKFLADTSPDKRRRMVDKLLDRPGYIMNFTRYWRRVMLPETDSDLQTRFLIPGFEAWLREQLTENTSYDEIARQIINTELNQKRVGYRSPAQLFAKPTPLAFYQAKQVAPENLAAATSRIFLGIRIECAQCHDHPFDTWKRDQFWSLAAFFGGIVREGQPNVFGQVREIPDRREISIPDTDQVVQAGYLDGSEPQWRFRVGARKTLADWVASRDNPYFARAAANRMWGHFFGRGIVEPVDDFSDANPPSHPELLDFLAKEFAAHEFDLKFLIRAITASRTYQLSSRRTHKSQADPGTLRPHERARPDAGATLRQPGPSHRDAGDVSSEQPVHLRQPIRARHVPRNLRRQRHHAHRSRNHDPASPGLDERPTHRERDRSRRSQTLAAVAEAPFLDTEGKIEALYLAALSRKPREPELAR